MNHIIQRAMVATALILALALGNLAKAEEKSGAVDSEASVPIDCDFNESFKLTASDAAERDRFGLSVSISGEFAVVGAYGDDNDAGSDAGAAYVYQLSGGSWREVTKLTASDAAASAEFGFSVSIHSHTIVVGARRSGDEGHDPGAAYVFQRDHGGLDKWGEVAKLTASDGYDGDTFGTSVSIDVDYVIIGADGESDAGDDSGSAYMFQRDYGGPDNWGEVTKIMPSDGAAGDHFGDSVSISGDTAIAGAAWTGANNGTTYIFERDYGGSNNWGEVTRLKSGTGTASDVFGYSVSIDGDTVLVGAWGSDVICGGCGAAYVFERNLGGPDNWGEVTILFGSVPGSSLGQSVVINGGIAVVGSLDEDAAYVFQRDRGGPDSWGRVAKLTASDAPAGWFSRSVSVSDNTVLVGDDGNDDNGRESGSAYLFDVSGNDCNSNGTADVCDIADCSPADLACQDCLPNGVPDACDLDPTDPDGNGVVSGDCNVNSIPDECEGGCNNNYIPDECDLDPTDPDGNQEVSADCDENGVPDECQTDCNGDGVPDVCELPPFGVSDDCDENGVPDECDPDCNDNLVPDACDISIGTSLDCNNNETPDECEPDDDCNENEVQDICDVASGDSPDCNQNGIPDECDVADGTSRDCDGDGIPEECQVLVDCNENSVQDMCDLADATSEDCNENLIPDECDPDEDCNTNGVQDICDVAAGTSEDCNYNEVPDECEPDEDCNDNGTRDICDIGAGTSDDCNLNNIPDVCDLDPSDPDGNGLVSEDADDNGVPDECERFPPALPADPIHQAPKNRYVSLDLSTNGTDTVAYELTLSAMRRCSGDLRRACETDADCPGVCAGDNDLQCVTDTICGSNAPCSATAPCVEHDDVGTSWWIGEPYTKTCIPNDDCVGEFFANAVSAPVYRVWTEDVVHLTGCEIVPVATYEWRGVDQVSGAVGEPLTVGTIEKPNLHYGDVVGAVVDGDWTPPQGVVNATDVSAYLISNQGGSGGTPPAHTTWVDVHSSSMPVVPQQILNVGDLSMIKFGFLGKMYSETPGQEDPGDCP